jgi:hypothetical protein
MPSRDVDVSVVIPCRDDHLSLLVALDAIAAQDFPASRREVIVVDGGGGEAADTAIRARGARLLSDGGRGPSAARNVGIDAARGDVVAFTDADCVPRFDWLTRLVDPFTQTAEVGGVAGGMRMPRRTLIGRMEDNDARCRYRGYITSNVAYRREVLLEVGGFDEDLVCAEDYDLAWRVMDAGHRIEREPRAIVLHATPEVDGSLSRYLAKQHWYARSDVPAHARALARWHASPDAEGSRRGLHGARDSAQHAAWVLALGVGVALRSPLILGAALVGGAAAAARHVAHSATQVGAGMDELVAMTAVEAAKRLVRGAGTLAGLAQLARPVRPLPFTLARGSGPWSAPRQPPAIPA